MPPKSAVAPQGSGKLITVEAFSDNRSVETEITIVEIDLEEDVVGLVARIDWADQGWGNQKGRIGIRGKLWNIFPEIAPHQRSVCYAQVDFDKGAEVKAGRKKFDLTHLVGGGGGHQLIVHDLKIRLFYASYFYRGFYNNLFTVQEVRKAPEGATPPDLVLWKSLSMMPWDIVVLVIQFLAQASALSCKQINVETFFGDWDLCGEEEERGTKSIPAGKKVNKKQA